MTMNLLPFNKTIGCKTWMIPAGPQVCAAFGSEVCTHCYAAQGRFTMPSVKAVIAERLKWWRRANLRQLDEAFRKAIGRAKYVRVFTSGDFSSVADVRKWTWICERNPQTKFWISTRCANMFRSATESLAALPNVCLRESFDRIDGYSSPGLDDWHQWSKTVTTPVTCRKCNEGSCGDCRRCWDKNEEIVEYKLHGHKVNWRKK